jgi:hypothetical protein
MILINIWVFSCLYMSHFVPALNGSCSCLPMGRDLGPNPARYIGCAVRTLNYFGSCCTWAVIFSVLRTGPSGPAQMYTYSFGYAVSSNVLYIHPLYLSFTVSSKRFHHLYLLPLQQRSLNYVLYTQIPILETFLFLFFVHTYFSYSQMYCIYFSFANLVI